jgi:5'-nucleotidase
LIVNTYILKPWAQSRALIVNDDGIEARGIKELESLARGLFAEVMVVAPAHEHSGMGHAISYKKKFNLRQIDGSHYAVEGTPADCTIVGLNMIMKDNPPDIVLSGINHGDNAGNAITYSGTFGGALEAGLHGVPAISFSQLRQEDKTTDFTVARKYFGQVMDFLQTAPWPDHVVMNVNFPPFDNHTAGQPHQVPSKVHHIVDGLDFEFLGEGLHSLFLRMKNRVMNAGHSHDLDVLAGGGVTITPIKTNWTCHETLKLWGGGL